MKQPDHSDDCLQHAVWLRDTLLVLGLMRYIHEIIAGQVCLDDTTDFGSEQFTASRALDILPITTAGEIISICLPHGLLCRDCRRELEKTLRMTVLSLGRLIELGEQDRFFKTLEQCMDPGRVA